MTWVRAGAILVLGVLTGRVITAITGESLADLPVAFWLLIVGIPLIGLVALLMPDRKWEAEQARPRVYIEPVHHAELPPPMAHVVHHYHHHMIEAPPGMMLADSPTPMVIEAEPSASRPHVRMEREPSRYPARPARPVIGQQRSPRAALPAPPPWPR